MVPYAGLDMLAGPQADGAEVEDFEYPVPLFVKNTFIDADVTRPASLQPFINERQAFSCPTSMISEPGSDCNGLAAGPPYPTLMPYSPGETFKKCATLGSSLPLVVSNGCPQATLPTSKPGKKGVAPASLHVFDQDAVSDCSTVDTTVLGAFHKSPPPSPAGAGFLRKMSGQSTDFLAAPPGLGRALPSKGSAGHERRECKPCAFMHTKGCSSGVDCQFCHLCPPGEKQRRQKDKRQFFGSMRQLQRIAAQAAAH